jgi:hypothetical protein
MLPGIHKMFRAVLLVNVAVALLRCFAHAKLHRLFSVNGLTPIVIQYRHSPTGSKPPGWNKKVRQHGVWLPLQCYLFAWRQRPRWLPRRSIDRAVTAACHSHRIIGLLSQRDDSARHRQTRLPQPWTSRLNYIPTTSAAISLELHQNTQWHPSWTQWMISTKVERQVAGEAI